MSCSGDEGDGPPHSRTAGNLTHLIVLWRGKMYVLFS
jgi:hypothetical protein